MLFCSVCPAESGSLAVCVEEKEADEAIDDAAERGRACDPDPDPEREGDGGDCATGECLWIVMVVTDDVQGC